MAIQPKFYETLYLVRPDISPDDLAVIQEKVTKNITSGNGEITRDEKWAERDLAYPINDYTRGTYYIVEFKALPNIIAGIEKHLAFHNVDVLRFMTVNVEEPSAKTADAPAADTAKSAPKESTPPPSSTTPGAPAASTQPEAAPEVKAEDTPPAAPSTPDADTPPESSSDESTSSTSGFTAAPPLSSSEDKESGGDN